MVIGSKSDILRPKRKVAYVDIYSSSRIIYQVMKREDRSQVIDQQQKINKPSCAPRIRVPYVKNWSTFFFLFFLLN